MMMTGGLTDFTQTFTIIIAVFGLIGLMWLVAMLYEAWTKGRPEK